MDNKPKNGTKIRRLLAKDDKGISESKGPLTTLWRTILLNLNIDYEVWKRLVALYLTNPDSTVGSTRDDYDNARNKLTRPLAYDNMSIKVLQHGLKLLRCERVTFTITLTPKNRRTTTVHKTDIWYGKAPSSAIARSSKVEKPINRFDRQGGRGININTAKLSSKPVLDMLASPDKKIWEATDVLSRLWRQILIDLKVSEMHWKSLMTSYLNTYLPANATSKGRSNTEENFNKYLVKNRMTMMVFLRTLALLQIEKYQLKLTIKRKGLSRVSVHIGSFMVPEPNIEFRTGRKTKDETIGDL